MIWIAPAEGLYLKSVNYDDYNKKDSIFESLELDEEEAFKVENFRNEKILPLIVEAEEKRAVFTEWLSEIKEK
jgi:hypothetical protein